MRMKQNLISPPNSAASPLPTAQIPLSRTHSNHSQANDIQQFFGVGTGFSGAETRFFPCRKGNAMRSAMARPCHGSSSAPRCACRCAPRRLKLWEDARLCELRMCGIVGLFFKRGAATASLGPLLAAMLSQMRERGPDGTGFALYGDEAPPGAFKATLRASDAGYDWAALEAGIATIFPV